MCMCMLCLKHLVKVGESISSNHIVFVMTASVLVINNALQLTLSTPFLSAGGGKKGA